MKLIRFALLTIPFLISACNHHDKDRDDPQPQMIQTKDGTYIPDPNCKNGKCPFIKKPKPEEQK